MEGLSRANFDPLTAERAFSFQIGERAAKRLAPTGEPVVAVDELQQPVGVPEVARLALQAAFENHYTVTGGR